MATGIMHNGREQARTEVYTYAYDYADRVSKVEHTLNGIKVTLADNTYDNLGRLYGKSLHGSAADKLIYAYNIRNWLTGITGTKFNQNLYYADGNNATKCYNGNISSMTWKAGDEGTVRGYKLTYDGLSRLATATYGETAAINTNLDRFTEKVSEYDKNGNIKKLQRYGQTTAAAYGMIDNLAYDLTGNLLNRVDDAVTTAAYNNGFEFKDAVKQAAEYAYDANGNLTQDLNKGITKIEYNVLNLPSKVTFENSSNTISYLYSADGTKLRTTHTIGGVATNTDYCGNVIYENGIAKQLITEEGYVSLSDNKYHYYLKDHQGNNRVVINQKGDVEETNHYYPFGGVYASTGNVQPYKYNGKEYDTKKGVNWYDYGARQYDAALGRFTTVDPLAEKYYLVSPYVYCLNNPVKFIDPDGRKVYFAPGVSAQFKHDFAISVQHLNKHGAADMLSKLESSEKVYYVAESANEYSQYNKGKNTITWASRYGLLTSEGVILSATSVLNHEVDHALQHDQNPKQQEIDGKAPSSSYKNKEEERVIKGTEQKTAKKLGEIKDGEITRKDHSGTLYEMKSSTSTEIKNELIIKPKK